MNYRYKGKRLSRNKLLASIIIGSGFALTQLSMLLYTPAMPKLSELFHVSHNEMMFSFTIAFAGYASGQLFWGTLSDRVGRRKVVITALCLHILSALACILSFNFTMFCIALFALGFCSACFTSVGNAIMRDIYGLEKAAQAIAYVGVVMAIAPSVGPLIGSYLYIHFSWHAIYLFLIIYAFAMLTGVITKVPETHQQITKSDQPLLKLFWQMICTPAYLRFLLALGLSFGAFFSYLDAAPFIYTQYLHSSTEIFGWLVLASTISYVLSTILVSRIMQKFGPAKLVHSGILISIIGGLLFLFSAYLHSHEVLAIIVPMFIAVFGFGMTVPSAKAGAMTTFTHNSGVASSLMKFVQISITVILTGIAARVHNDSSIIPIASLILISCILAGICFWYVSKQGNQHVISTTL